MSVDCWCDYDPPLFYNRTKPKARGAYRCDECGATIEPGQRYERVNAKWPDTWGGVDTFLTCEPCHDLRQWTQNNVPCLCWAHGNMIEDCRNAVQDAVERAPDETVGLRFGFARRLLARTAAKRLAIRRTGGGRHE